MIEVRVRVLVIETEVRRTRRIKTVMSEQFDLGNNA